MAGQQQYSWARAAYLIRRGVIWLTQGGFPFALPSPSASPMARRRRRVGRREVLRRWPLIVRPIAWALMIPGWMIGSWLSTRHLCRAYGEKVTSWRSPRQIWWRALRYNTSPREVVEYRLGEPGSGNPDEWIMELELFRTWERLASRKIRLFAADKVAFAEFCEQAELPHPPLLAVWRNGVGNCEPDTWPVGVVFKPALSNNAQGFEAWHQQKGHYSRGNEMLSPAGLATRGEELSRHWALLLAQPLLTLHPNLALRGLSGMPVARLITGVWPDGRVEVLDAYLSAPQPGRIASNVGYGPKWPVDIDTGTIEPSVSPLLPAWHGDQRIEGLVLPDWHMARDAVLAGHKAFPEPVPALGWDVAFTADGPVLLETNTGLSFAMPQGTRQRPAGLEKPGQLLDAWLRRPP